MRFQIRYIKNARKPWYVVDTHNGDVVVSRHAWERFAVAKCNELNT